MDITKNTIRSSAYGMASRVIVIVFSFIVRTILIYKLGSEYVGLNSIFTSIFTLLNLSELGIGSAIVFYMYKPIAEDDIPQLCQLLHLYRKIYRCIGLFIIIGGLLCLPFLNLVIKEDVPSDINIYLLYVILLFNTASDYFFLAYKTVIFSAYQRNDLKAKIDIITNCFIYIIQGFILLFFGNYYLYTIALLLAIIPKNILIENVYKKEYSKIVPTNNPDKYIIKDIFSKVIPLLGHKIGATFLVSIDSIIISAFLGLKVLGVYNNYYYIVTAVFGFTSIVQQSLIAGIGHKLVVNSKEDMLLAYRRSVFAWNWLIGWCAICFICLFQNFIIVWTGESYLLPLSTVSLIVLYYYSWQARVMGLTFKDAAGLWKKDWPKPYIGMLLNTTFSIYLVYLTNSIIGVLVPTILIFAFLYFPWESHVISSEIFHVRTMKIVKITLLQTLVTVCVGAIAFLCCGIIPGNNLLTLIVRILVVILLPNALFVFIYRKQDVFQYFKELVLTKVKGGLKRG